MKKFLLFLMAAIFTVVANATDFYLIGGFNGWNLADASCKFTQTGNGVYTLNYNGTLTPGFKVNDGTWGATYDIGSNGSNLVVGTAYNYKIGSGSGNISMSDNVTNPTIVLDLNAGTLLVKGQEVAAEYVYVLHGDFEVSGNWADVPMYESNGKWTSKVTATTACNFGIKKADKTSGAQVEWISAAGNAAVVLDSPMSCKVEGTNFSLAKGEYTFTFDPNAMTLTATGTQGGNTPDPVVPEDPDYTKWYVNLGSDNWSGDYWNGVAGNAEGIVSFSDVELGGMEFAIKIWDGANDLFYYANNIALDTPTVCDKAAEQTPSTIAGAAAGDKFNVTYNLVSNTITVVKVGGSVVNPPVNPEDPDYTKWYVNLGSDNWSGDYWNGVAANAEGIVSFSDVELGGMEFAIKIWDGANDLFYYANNIALDTPTVCDKAAEQTPSTITGAAVGDKFNVTYNLVSNTITVVKVGGSVVNPEPELTLYIVGENYGNWGNDGNGIAMEKITDNKYTVELADGLKDKWKIWNGTWDYSFGQGGESLKANVAQEVWFNFSTDFDLNTKGTTIITLEIPVGAAVNGSSIPAILTVNGESTGVEEIATEEGEAIYFNLNGIKVANPENGLYIKVVGNKASKVLLNK